MITTNQSILGAGPSGENSIPEVVKAAAQGPSVATFEMGDNSIAGHGLFLTPTYFIIAGPVPFKVPTVFGKPAGGDEPPTIEKFSILNRGVAWSSGGTIGELSKNRGTAYLKNSDHILDFISPGNYDTQKVNWLPTFTGLHLTNPPTGESGNQIPIAKVAWPFPGSGAAESKNANRGEPVYAVIAHAQGKQIIPGFVTYGKRNSSWTDKETLKNWLTNARLKNIPSSQGALVMSSFQSYWFPIDLPPGTPIFTQRGYLDGLSAIDFKNENPKGIQDRQVPSSNIGICAGIFLNRALNR